MSLRHAAISGTAWTGVARAFRIGGNFLTTIVLARLLAIEDFGTIGMIVVFTGFAEIFLDCGFGSALVQHKDIEAAHLQSVFWLTLLIGFVFTVLSAVVAPAIAEFYTLPALEDICRVVGANFVIAALGVVPRALLTRRMAFRELAIAEIAATFGSMTVGILLALNGYGVWSLVAQILAGTALTTICVWHSSAWRPALSFQVKAIRSLLNYSVNLTGFATLNYWAGGSVQLIIGKFLGAESLGLYVRSQGLVMFPIANISSIFLRVMFPVLSSIQLEVSRVRQIYLRTLGVLVMVSFPMLLGLAVVADPFVRVVFGEKWIDMVLILQILCLSGLVRVMCNPVGWIYNSLGRTDWQLWWGLASTAVTVSAVAIGAWLGDVESIAMGYAVANFLLLYPCYYMVGKLIGMTLGDLHAAVGGSFLAAVCMALCVIVAGALIPESWAPWQRLIIQVVVGVCSYMTLLVGLPLSSYTDLRSLFSKQLMQA